MADIRYVALLGTLFFTQLLAGCASTTVNTSGMALTAPLCTADAPASVALYWLPRWRLEQKEPAVREALIERGLDRFRDRHLCLTVRDIARLPATNDGMPDDVRLLARARDVHAERAVQIVVRELGPRVLIGLPVLLEGGTEVVIDVRVLNVADAGVLANNHTQWRHGGPFYLKGIGSLDRDLDAALSAVLLDTAAQTP